MHLKKFQKIGLVCGSKNSVSSTFALLRQRWNLKFSLWIIVRGFGSVHKTTGSNFRRLSWTDSFFFFFQCFARQRADKDGSQSAQPTRWCSISCWVLLQGCRPSSSGERHHARNSLLPTLPSSWWPIRSVEEELQDNPCGASGIRIKSDEGKSCWSGSSSNGWIFRRPLGVWFNKVWSWEWFCTVRSFCKNREGALRWSFATISRRFTHSIMNASKRRPLLLLLHMRCYFCRFRSSSFQWTMPMRPTDKPWLSDLKSLFHY